MTRTIYLDIALICNFFNIKGYNGDTYFLIIFNHYGILEN